MGFGSQVLQVRLSTSLTDVTTPFGLVFSPMPEAQGLIVQGLSSQRTPLVHSWLQRVGRVGFGAERVALSTNPGPGHV